MSSKFDTFNHHYPFIIRHWLEKENHLVFFIIHSCFHKKTFDIFIYYYPFLSSTVTGPHHLSSTSNMHVKEKSRKQRLKETSCNRPDASKRSLSCTLQCRFFTIIFLLVFFCTLNSQIDNTKFQSHIRMIPLEYTWSHAVNDQDTLKVALLSAHHAIEADIIYSSLQECSVMGHPPHTDGTLTLYDFLHTIYNYNTKRIVKLDFKSMIAFQHGVKHVEEYALLSTSSSLWLNADILQGPSNTLQEASVMIPHFDAKIFLKTLHAFKVRTYKYKKVHLTFKTILMMM